MRRLQYLYAAVCLAGSLLIQIPECYATDNSYILGNVAPDQLRIEILSGGNYQVFRHDEGDWVRQFWSNTPLFALRIGSSSYTSTSLARADISATTTGTQQHVTKQFSGTYSARPFSVTYTISYNTSNPDYFIITTVIDASQIPAGTTINIAYGFDAFVNGCDGGAAITIPDLGYNNQPETTVDLTQTQVRGSRLVGGMNNNGNGSLIGFFTMGRSFDRARSCYYTNTAPSVMLYAGTNTFLFGPYNGVPCASMGTWDNGVGVAYDNIPAGETTTIRTGLTFTTNMDGELDYTWNGNKNLTANIGDHVNLDLVYRSYNSQTINGIGFDVDLRGLVIDASCTESGFISGAYACMMGSSMYGVSGAAIGPYDSATMSVPVLITQCGQWIIGADAIDNMSRTLPLGTPATLTVISSIGLLPVSAELCQDDSLSFSLAFPPGVSSAFDFHVNLSYTGDLASFGILPASVLFPADSNRISINVQPLPGIQTNTVLNVSVTGTDKVFVTVDSTTVPSVSLRFGAPNSLTTTDVMACSGAMVAIAVSSADSTATLTWYSDPARTVAVATGASFTTTATADTIFYVGSVSDNSCESNDSVRISLHPTPALTAADTAGCPGAAVTFLASTTDATDSIRWYADPAHTSLLAQGGSFGTTATAPATYYIRALSAHSCTTDDTVTLAIYPLPALTASGMTACPGTAVTLVATTTDATDSIRWYADPAHTSLLAQGGSFGTTATAPATYYVQAVSAHSCTAARSVALALYPLPVLTTHDTTVCAGFTVPLNASTGNPADTLRWYADDAYSALLAQTPTYITPALTAAATYYIEASGAAGGCPTRGHAEVSITSPPEVVAMDSRRICYGDEITLSLIHAEGDITWNTPELTLRPTATATYTVTAARPPCPNVHDTVVITVGDEIYILPDALPPYKRNIYYSQQLTSNAQTPVYTLADGQLPAGILLAANGTLEGLPFQIEYNDTGYAFRLQVTDQYGCSGFIDYRLRGGFSIPEVFSPNGDGVNDHFMKGLRVVVFDRLGRKIFEGPDGWDGSHNRRNAPDDTYYYILFYIDENANEIHTSGFITIQR
ncbi:MAG: gliding motility-associated C-terminal domain-containing protein [Prevotellaceae bacterium]|jgi:gliding motility-associated-like protein|nr:gliding motility-associated C-terminal domain-containing protein [Prevotellaceae bacterium]